LQRFVATTLGWLGRRKDAWERAPRKLLTGLLGLLLDVELDAFARTGIAEDVAAAVGAEGDLESGLDVVDGIGGGQWVR
jgi:hypothetical protein